MVFIVGLTGGIGSGKTAVSDYLQTLDVTVVDADVVAREVVEPGSPGLAQIVEHFGEGILQPDGSLDRAKLRQIVFADTAQKKVLEGITHPAIFERMWQQLQAASSPYAVLVSPLLIEGGAMKGLCQHVIVVDTPEAVQLARTMARDQNSAEQVQAIMAAQADRQTRLAAADTVLINDGSLAQLQQQVASLHQQLSMLAKQAEH